MVLSSSTVIHWAQVLSLLTMTVRPSMATGISMYSRPASSQSWTSLALMGREASEIWVSPLQNFLNPPPVPETPTVTRTLPSVSLPNSSATASVMGNTVLEPSISMSPFSVAYSLAFMATGMDAPPPELPEAGCWEETEEPVDAPPPELPEAGCWEEAEEPVDAPPAWAGWSGEPQAIRTMEIAMAPRMRGMVQPFTLEYRGLLGDIFPPVGSGWSFDDFLTKD